MVPWLRALSSNAGSGGFTPGLEAKIPHALWPENQDTEQQKQYCNNFNKDFLNGPHPKKKKSCLGQQGTDFFLGYLFQPSVCLSVCLSPTVSTEQQSALSQHACQSPRSVSQFRSYFFFSHAAGSLPAVATSVALPS